MFILFKIKQKHVNRIKIGEDMDSNKSVLQINLCELNYNSGKAVGGSIVVFD